jgi:hypothetical protein
MSMPPRDPTSAAEFIITSVRFSKPDVVAAKQFLFEKAYGMVVTLADQWVAEVGTSVPKEAPLYETDPTPILADFARNVSLRFALFKAAWSLVQSGVLIPMGATATYKAQWGYTNIPPGGSGSQGGIHLDSLTFPHPERVTRVLWSDDNDELNDADLYLRNLANVTLHPGIEAALRKALLCLRQDLYDPAAAMLGAAMEGAWVELGTSLVFAAGDSNTGKPGKIIVSDRAGIRDRIESVCKLYEKQDLYSDLWEETGVRPQSLQEIGAWSDVVRESRNILHWKARTKPNNSYSKVATLLMAALERLGRLHAVKEAADAMAKKEDDA